MSGFSRHVYNSYKKLSDNNGYYIIGSDCDINILELLRNEHRKAPLMPRVEIKDLTIAIHNSRKPDGVTGNPLTKFTVAMLVNMGLLDDMVNETTIDFIKNRLK